MSTPQQPDWSNDPLAEGIRHRLQGASNTMWDAGQDPVDSAIDHVLRSGKWSLQPSIALGGVENSLVRRLGQHTDVVSIPDIGDFTLARISGGPPLGRPRCTGHVLWYHRVPALVAAEWLLGDTVDDRELVEWTRRFSPLRDP